MSIANLAHVNVSCVLTTGTGDEAVNVFAVQNRTGSPVDYATAVADLADVFDDIYAVVNPAISETYLYDRISFWDVEGAAPMGIVDWPVLTVGGASGDPMPSQVAGFVYFRTHKSRCIGKKFVPGPVEGNSDTDGRPTVIYRQTIAEMGEQLLGVAGYLPTAGWGFQILSSTDGLYYDPYAWLTPPVWSTVRRRRIGRGS